jgi:hypothetical protein
VAGTALKIQKFFGEAPKISGELLPETVAQFAVNLDLSSGDLLPYRRSQAVAPLTKLGEVRAIFPMKDPDTGELFWLNWNQDVDVALSQVDNDTSQRIYYTGDGPPKTTDFEMATSGADYPAQSYVLGLPLPVATPVVEAIPFTEKSSTHRRRDAGNTVTITTSAPHGLTTGDYVTTTGFGGTAYNLSNTQVTVINPTQFSYFSFGAAEANTADVNGRVNLAGLTYPRDYVFTYYTEWEEESIPSEPSATIFVKEGQPAQIDGLPSLWTHGPGYQETGMKLRLYRTVAGIGGTEYFRVAELDLAAPIAATYTRAGNTVTVTATAHGMVTGDFASFRPIVGDATAGTYEVTVAGPNAFSFTDPEAGTTSGACQYAPALSFMDDEDVSTLDNILESADYDPPDPEMQGLLSIHNNMLVGFVGNSVCFSEPGKPHAWPLKYRQPIDAPIIALGAYGTTLLALTERTPWKLDGNNPSAISLTRTDYLLPCLSKASVINIGFGVVWASAGGLAVYSTTIGTDYLTKNVHSWTTWSDAVNPGAIAGAYYRGRYFGSDGVGSFMFERNEQVGGHLVQAGVRFTAAHYDAAEDKLYFARDGQVWLWDSANLGFTTLDWKSKVFTTKNYLNFGAARVIADYDDTDAAEIEQENAAIRATNRALIDSGDPMGALGTVMANQYTVAGSGLTPFRQSFNTATFQLYVNKRPIATRVRTDSSPFRLPAGYRADTFEIRVTTTVRVRAIHLAETMAGLKGT